MAPAVRLPILEMSNLPDLHIGASRKSERWADIVDVGTPSPWHDEALADFKLGRSWPDTPTPCNSPEPKFFEATTKGPFSASDQICINGNDMSTMIGAIVGMTFPVPAQTCQAGASTSSSAAIVGFQGSEMSVSSMFVASNGLSLQPCLPQAYQVITMPDISAQGWTSPAFEIPRTFVQNDWSNQQVQMNAVHVDFAEMREWGREASHDITSALCGSACRVGPPCSFNVSGSGAIEPTPGQWKVDIRKMRSQSEHNTIDSSGKTVSQQQQPADHVSGQCKPCAWFWRPQGCRNGSDCQYCHLCPEGELKSRKRNKMAAMKSGALRPVKAQAGNGWSLKLESLLSSEAV